VGARISKEEEECDKKGKRSRTEGGEGRKGCGA
jgi:hypothetical protein